MLSEPEVEDSIEKRRRMRRAIVSLYYALEQPSLAARYPGIFTTPELVPQHIGLLSVDDAIEEIVNEGGRSARQAASLAMGALARAVPPYEDVRLDRMMRLFPATNGNPSQEGPDVLLERLRQVLEISDSTQRFSETMRLILPCEVHLRETRFTFHKNISTCTGTVWVNREVGQFKGGIDPRKWSAGFPLFWEKSLRCGSLPEDRDEDPVQVNPDPPGTWQGLLYEQVGWRDASAGLLPSLARCAINIDYTEGIDAANNTGADRNEFSLFECLSSSFFDPAGHYGGIDVDSGHCVVEPVTGHPGWTSITASKSLRLTKPELLVGVINPIISGFVIAFIDGLLYFGACRTA